MRSPEQDREQDAMQSARWRQAAFTVPVLAISAGLGRASADPAAPPRAKRAGANLLQSWKANHRRVMEATCDAR
jgi:hypothetical protein